MNLSKRSTEQEQDKSNPKRQKVPSQDEQTVIGRKSKQQKSKKLRKHSVRPWISVRTRKSSAAVQFQIKSPMARPQQKEYKETRLMNGGGTSVSCSRTSENDPNPDITDRENKQETNFTPEKIHLSRSLLYRFRCPSPGTFHCSSTGLMFVVTKKAELQYRTIQWDEALLQSSGRTPAGPLYEIECPERAVCELHLPHCEPKTADFSQSQLSAAHFSEDKQESIKLEEFIKPKQITQSHVVIKVSTLSGYGLTAPSGENNAIAGQLWVSEWRNTTEYISATAICHNDVVIDQSYSVVCPNAENIQPKEARFSMDNDPNYHPLFELRFSKETTKAFLKIQKTGDDSEEGELWRYEVYMKDPTRRALKSHPWKLRKDNLEVLRPKFVQKVSGPILNQLLDHLEGKRYLNSEEVETVKGKKTRADKAREVFDTVKKKGFRALEYFIKTYCELDPKSCLSKRMKKLLSETQ